MTIPAHFLEATNGALWLVLAFAGLAAVWYLVQSRRQIGSWRILYLEEKASIALALMFLSLSTRLGNIWWIQHQRNHNVMVPWLGAWTTLIHAWTSVLAVIAVMCWLRCTLPSEYFGWKGWALLTFAAFAFGAIMAL